MERWRGRQGTSCQTFDKDRREKGRTQGGSHESRASENGSR
jgi:hypothetical protein